MHLNNTNTNTTNNSILPLCTTLAMNLRKIKLTGFNFFFQSHYHHHYYNYPYYYHYSLGGQVKSDRLVIGDEDGQLQKATHRLPLAPSHLQESLVMEHCREGWTG